MYSSVYELLKAQAGRAPESVAILAPDQASLTYSRLQGHVRSVVARLNELGIGRNDRVAIVLPNGPNMAVAFLSVAAGATSAPLNPAYRAPEFDFYLSDLNAKALVILAGMDSPAIKVAQARGIPVIELVPTVDGKVVANMQAAARYVPRMFPGRIVLFLTGESLEGSSGHSRLGWREWATGGAQVCAVPGTHDTVTRTHGARPLESDEQALAEKLRECIDGAQIGS